MDRSDVHFIQEQGEGREQHHSKLSATQIGAIAENLVANELMIESKGRLSSFQPVADDDGINVLIYDKQTGRAVPIQIKTRTPHCPKGFKTTDAKNANCQALISKASKLIARVPSMNAIYQPRYCRFDLMLRYAP